MTRKLKQHIIQVRYGLRTKVEANWLLGLGMGVRCWTYEKSIATKMNDLDFFERSFKVTYTFTIEYLGNH